MNRSTAVIATLAILGLAGVAPARAVPTDIVVRVLAKDAKFIGTSMGGVRVTVTDADTGQLLASALTRGGTGNTGHIMETDWQRGKPLGTGDSARAELSIDINEPVLVKISARGPLAQRQSAGDVSVTHWVVPGKHLSGGDGMLLVMPGFVVDVLDPPTHRKLKGVTEVELRANVTMMCGCPLTPGGLWDADGFEVMALVRRNGAPAGQLPLTYAGSPSQFSSKIDITQPGTYEAIVYAYDPDNGNTGLDRVTFIVSK